MKRLKVLLVGAGTVGEAIAKVARGKPWLERMVLADYNLERAREVQAMLGDGAESTFPAECVDAGGHRPPWCSWRASTGVDLVMNAADPRFVPTLFDAAFEAGTDYMDMAVSLSEPDASDPSDQPGRAARRLPVRQGTTRGESAGRLALLGHGHGPRPHRRLRALRRAVPLR